MNYRSTAVYSPVRWNSAKTTTQPSGSADHGDDITEDSIDTPDVADERHATDDSFDANGSDEQSDPFI
jgi:hypothetical protein